MQNYFTTLHKSIKILCFKREKGLIKIYDIKINFKKILYTADISCGFL